MRHLTNHPDAAARIEMLMRILIDPEAETNSAARTSAAPTVVETTDSEA